VAVYNCSLHPKPRIPVFGDRLDGQIARATADKAIVEEFGSRRPNWIAGAMAVVTERDESGDATIAKTV
jgi:hypothetical protein